MLSCASLGFAWRHSKCCSLKTDIRMDTLTILINTQRLYCQTSGRTYAKPFKDCLYLSLRYTDTWYRNARWHWKSSKSFLQQGTHLRYEVAKGKSGKWKAIQHLAFTKDCVFIDESGFKLHTQRSVGRSLKGTPARGTIPTGRGVTSILGAIPEAWIIDISLKKPQAIPMSKKTKGNGKVVIVINGRIGTRAEHYLAYLCNVMDVLDRNNMSCH